MSESTQRARVVRALKPLDAMPVENPAKPGTPDVEFIGGWIELKWFRSWPKRAKKDNSNFGPPVRIEHFTIKQRRWLRRRAQKGGWCFLLLQVGREWLLFDGLTAATLVGNVNRHALYRAARRIWTKGLIDGELLQCLQELTTQKRKLR